MEAYVGSIFAFGFNFPPVGWALCNGQTMNIADNEVLYTLLGTTYGGNGQTTFALPNLMGRVPVGTGQGAGLHNYLLGQTAGVEALNIISANLANHTHVPSGSIQIPVSNQPSTTSSPSGAYFAASDSVLENCYSGTSNSPLAASSTTTSIAGTGSQGIEIMNPYLVVNYCICTNGLFPPHP